MAPLLLYPNPAVDGSGGPKMHGSNFESTDGAEETIISTVELREMNSLSEEITTVLVEYADKPYDQIGPLEEQIDTDALDSLFKPDGTDGSQLEAHLRFQFDEWHVDVDSSGYFQIKRVEDCPPR